MKFIYLFLFALSSYTLSSQCLTYNFGFQNGDENRLQCHYTPITSVIDLVDYWQPTFPTTENNTFDWVDYDYHFKPNSYCRTRPNIDPNDYLGDCLPKTYNPSNKIIERYAHEAMIGNLKTSLKSSKTYLVRMKISQYCNPNKKTVIHLGLCSGIDKKINHHYSLVYFTIPVNKQHNWYAFEYQFSIPSKFNNELKYIIVESVNSTKDNVAGRMQIDEIELYEYCKPNLYFQNRDFVYREENTIYDVEYPFEAVNIIAGNNVYKEEASGDVNIKSTASVIYKAEETIQLMPGFNVELGAEFEARISECGFMYPRPFLDLQHCYILCSDNPIKIGAVDPEKAFTYKWTSEQNENLAYLDNLTISNPTFTPPITGHCKTFKYTLTITNEGDESQSYDIVILYSKTPDNNPTIDIVNYDNKSNYFSFTANLGACTEKIKIEVFNCENQPELLEKYEYTRLCDDEFSSTTFNWKMPKCLDGCICKQVKISVKNICSKTWSDVITLPWPKQKFDTYIPNIITPDGDGTDDCFLLYLKGIKYYSITFYNRYGMKVHKSSGSGLFCDPICVWDGGNYSGGTYYYIANFIDCDGNNHKGFRGTITLIKGDESFQLEPNNFNEYKIANNEYFKIFPNPFTTTINLEIKGFNEDGETIFELYNTIGNKVFSKSINSTGLFSIDVSMLPVGIYLCRVVNNNNLIRKKIIKL